MFACSLLAAALTAVPISDGWRVQRAEGTVLTLCPPYPTASRGRT